MSTTISQFFAACQPFGYPLLACSVILVTAILYHLIFTGNRKSVKQITHVLEQAREGDADPVPALTDLCLKSSSLVAVETLYAIRHKDDERLEQRTEARLRMLVDSERAGMATISVITNIAPMLGILLGPGQDIRRIRRGRRRTWRRHGNFHGSLHDDFRAGHCRAGHHRTHLF